MLRFLLQSAENDLSSKHYHAGREVSECTLHALRLEKRLTKRVVTDMLVFQVWNEPQCLILNYINYEVMQRWFLCIFKSQFLKLLL